MSGTGKTATVRFKKGSCMVCGLRTETAMAVQGTPEFAVVVLVKLGIPFDQAQAALSHITGCEQGMVPSGDIEVVIRVCVSCASRSIIDIEPQPIESGRIPGVRETAP